MQILQNSFTYLSAIQNIYNEHTYLIIIKVSPMHLLLAEQLEPKQEALEKKWQRFE